MKILATKISIAWQRKTDRLWIVSPGFARKGKAKESRDQGRTEKWPDPILSRLERKQTQSYANSQTFESVAMEWHGTNLDHWDARYAKTVLHRLEKYVFVEIGSYPINTIKPLIILSCLQKIEKSAPEMARRMKQLCSDIFKYAIVTNRIEHDVTYGLECALKKFKRGHFASLSVDELPEFLNTSI